MTGGISQIQKPRRIENPAGLKTRRGRVLSYWNLVFGMYELDPAGLKTRRGLRCRSRLI